MGVIVAWSIGGMGSDISSVRAHRWSLDKSMDAICINSSMFGFAYTVMNTLTDVMVLALPIAPIMSLPLGMRNKLMVGMRHLDMGAL